MGGSEPWGGSTGSWGTSGEEGLGGVGSVVRPRQLEPRANSGLATGTPCVPVQVHCIFLFFWLNVTAFCTIVFLCQKRSSAMVLDSGHKHFLFQKYIFISMRWYTQVTIAVVLSITWENRARRVKWYVQGIPLVPSAGEIELLQNHLTTTTQSEGRWA